MEDLVRRGRARGLGITMITQRSASINKDLLTQIEVLVAKRTIAPQDRDAIEAWVKVHGTPEQQKVMMESLPSLPGEAAWIWSPGWLDLFRKVTIRKLTTLDSSATPEVGKHTIAPRRLADVEVARLRERMAETIERARQEDPRELRTEIARLKKELGKKKAAPAAEGGRPAEGKTDKVAIERAIVQAAVRGARGLQREMAPILKRARKAMARGIVDLRTVAAQLEEALLPEQFEFKTTVDLPPAGVRDSTEKNVAARRPAANGAGGAGQRVLDALAELEVLGVAQPPRVQVAFLAGYTNLNSKGFVNALGALRTAGNICYPSPGTVGLTDDGRAMAEPADAPRTTEELQQRLLSMLGGANGRIVQALVDTYPDALRRADLAASAGYTNLNSKGFVNAIGRLRMLGFIDYPEPGTVRANDRLFLSKRQGA
jgi:hypothetical protein